MSIITNHGPKILLAAVAAGCGVFAFLESSASNVDPKSTAGVDANIEKIRKAVNSRTVSEKYPFGVKSIGDLKYQEDAAATFERATKRFESEIPAFVAYQVPARPKVDEGSRPATADELTHYQDAELRDLSEIKASGDHGRIFVTFKVPQKMKYMEPQRIEIFRGESEAKIDTKTPYATIEFSAEETPSARSASKEEAAEEKKPADDTAEISAGARRRKERAGGDEKEPAKPGREPKKAAVEEIPAEYADVKVFGDTHVEPKVAYFYKLRLVGKMSVMPEKRVEEKDANGVLQRITVVRPPKGAQTVPPARAGAQVALFATPISGVVSAAPPSNFEIRLAGTSGKIDPPGTPEYKKSKEYKGTFAVRVWVTEAQVWKEITVQASPDERLKGAIFYKSDTKEQKNFEFDANYKLAEIKWGETVRETEVDEPELDKEGNPVTDPKTRKIKMVKRMKKGDPIPNEIAVLEDLTSHALEEFPKRADFKAREKSLAYYAQIFEEQQKADKVFKVKMEKVKERIKADDDTRKAKAQSDADAANAANAAAAAQPAAGGGGGGGGNRSAGKGKN